jgi:hypothetical protein
LTRQICLIWRYVCRPAYYEGRHTDLQLIFSEYGETI